MKIYQITQEQLDSKNANINYPGCDKPGSYTYSESENTYSLVSSSDEIVPGLKALEDARDAAYNEQARYDAELNRMMETGHSIYPKPIDKTLQQQASNLAKAYPQAAMYLRAKSYTFASNHRKVGAGEKAMELIAAGGSLEDAEEILTNWIPEESKWN